jgi:hypothetical protein
MQARRIKGHVLAIVIVGVGAACAKSTVPGETVSTTTLPPIMTCYESDGAPCPLVDAGNEGGSEGGNEAGDDGGADADAAVTPETGRADGS